MCTYITAKRSTRTPAISRRRKKIRLVRTFFFCRRMWRCHSKIMHSFIQKLPIQCSSMHEILQLITFCKVKRMSASAKNTCTQTHKRQTIFAETDEYKPIYMIIDNGGQSYSCISQLVYNTFHSLSFTRTTHTTNMYVFDNEWECREKNVLYSLKSNATESKEWRNSFTVLPRNHVCTYKNASAYSNASAYEELFHSMW